jgi:large subunit ribosomal protein L24
MAANPKWRIRKDDQVVVTSGKDRGKLGRVMQLFPNEGRALVEKVNVVKRHSKPSAKNRQGGIIEKEASIHLSNLMLVDPKDGKKTRVGIRVENGKKIRFSKRSNEQILTK